MRNSLLHNSSSEIKTYYYRKTLNSKQIWTNWKKNSKFGLIWKKFWHIVKFSGKPEWNSSIVFTLIDYNLLWIFCTWESILVARFYCHYFIITGWKFSFQSTETFLNVHGMLIETRISGTVQWPFSGHLVPLNAAEWQAHFSDHSVIFFIFRVKNSKKYQIRGFKLILLWITTHEIKKF